MPIHIYLLTFWDRKKAQFPDKKAPYIRICQLKALLLSVRPPVQVRYGAPKPSEVWFFTGLFLFHAGGNHTQQEFWWELALFFVPSLPEHLRWRAKWCRSAHPQDRCHNNITAHMLRHTYATMLFDAGVDVKSAQRFLGHEDIEVTLSIYTHLTKFKEDQAVYALNEHLDEMIETKQFLTTIQWRAHAKKRLLHCNLLAFATAPFDCEAQ